MSELKTVISQIMKKFILFSLGCILLITSSCIQKSIKIEVVDYHLNPFRLDQVELMGGPFRDAMELDKQYLLSLDMDRLLVD